jgi:hypothetical protein
MKKIILALGLSMFAISLYAADAAKEPTAQQSKMTVCNADAKAKNLAGEDRKKFMSECLSAKKDAAAAAPAKELTPQQAKMKQCNADAKTKNLTGADRKKFMSDCLKAK